MIGLLRTVPLRKRGETIAPFLLAALIVVLGVVVYLELVTALLTYAG